MKRTILSVLLALTMLLALLSGCGSTAVPSAASAGPDQPIRRRSRHGGAPHRNTRRGGDLSINRLYVTGKRVDEAGRHLVDLSWWCETIEHQIHTEGTATVELPSRT